MINLKSIELNNENNEKNKNNKMKKQKLESNQSESISTDEEETNMNYYIDSLGRLIYESCNMKSEIVGVEFIQEDYILFNI